MSRVSNCLNANVFVINGISFIFIFFSLIGILPGINSVN